MYSFIIKKHNFRGDLSGISAKTATLLISWQFLSGVLASVFALADTSVRSPRNYSFLNINICMYRIKVLQKHGSLCFENKITGPDISASFLAEISVSSPRKLTIFII